MASPLWVGWADVVFVNWSDVVWAVRGDIIVPALVERLRLSSAITSLVEENSGVSRQASVGSLVTSGVSLESALNLEE